MRTRWPYIAAGILTVSIHAQAQTPKTYGGPGSCNSSGCHGSIWPKTGGRIGQNEYQVWATKDRHSKAYSVLLEPRSKQIAKNLRIDKPESSATCLDCHATNVPAAERSTTFDPGDGVGCESCHGASAGWIQPHTTRNWTHDQSIKAGMTDLSDVKQRVEVCLSCHLGNKDKTVSHELIAAGHPDLIFELETFTALMPAHWQPANQKTDSVHRWAVSQMISLRDSMEQMGRRAAGETRSPWPDFADFECSSCHHNLVTPSPRQTRGYAGRAGLPPWNESRYIVTRRLIGAIAPAALTDLDSRISELQKAFENPSAARTAPADSIKRIVDLVNETIPQIEKASFDANAVTKLLKNIAADADDIGLAGLASAEQATMSIDVLYNVAHPGKRDDAVNAQIDGLYRLLQSKTGYDAEQFANALKKIGPLF